MAKGEQLVEGRWRIVETGMWDQEALDLVAPAHITFGRNGLGEMQLIAIGASIDYRVDERRGTRVVEFSWSGFDEMDPSSGRARAKIEGDTMRGELFIHQGDQSTFVAKRERVGWSILIRPPVVKTRKGPVTGAGGDRRVKKARSVRR